MLEIHAQRIRYAPDATMSPHTDGCRRLSILVGGEVQESDRERTELARVGSVALKAPDFVHKNRFGHEGTTILSVILSDTVVGHLGYDAARLRPWQWHHGGEPSLTALRLAVALARTDGAIAARCLKHLLQSFVDRAEEETPSVPPNLQHLAEILRLAPQHAPGVGERAAQAGMHPVALGRAFRRHYGHSISRFRQRARVASVAHALLDGSSPLVEVALDHGFSDLSHMTRVFRREIGVPPGLFRRTLGAPGHGGDAAEWCLTA